MAENKYIATIGLEIHVELKTASKMFCSCKNDPHEKTPNLNICPICLGHPGTLPVLNMEAVRHVLKIGLVAGGTLADFTEWDRKNYFYPDIPKGYQISQYAHPLINGGSIASVPIERIHLEEDTAQLTHDTHQKSLINFNRAGLPLLELVTKPVIHDAGTAVSFAKELQLLLRYLNAGEANMEKGQMRIEANISVSTPGDAEKTILGRKIEIKNLNSFNSIERAIIFETARQTSLLASGGSLLQETRGWDDRAGETFSQRAKETSDDYRYFPEPDIPKVRLSEIAEFRSRSLEKEIPELPWVKRMRFKRDFNMTDKEAAVMIELPEIAEYFELIIVMYREDEAKVRLTINYLLTDYLSKLRADPGNAIPAASFADLIGMIHRGEISSRGAKDLLSLLISEKDALPPILAPAHGLIQKSDSADLWPAVQKVIDDHKSVVAEYKKGKTTSLEYLIGQVMKMTKGAANPEIARKLLIEKLS
ncbi:MAG: aspartyl-tRNA(Asn)/glutamyl-tRNA(Gln) amidotransferase subunit [Candidatus Parcubacteria bacterium]|jgi:aspartyl-tRNA(Asn)/glutamyl-tRNA(Gln) amidotransferase subunit B|nr:aspartyl-tRNA(Asn)/glutamyl-tRNA(Gln) amidotransferase subunit [Candidatus Parcubacteria bacterium]